MHPTSMSRCEYNQSDWQVWLGKQEPAPLCTQELSETSQVWAAFLAFSSLSPEQWHLSFT